MKPSSIATMILILFSAFSSEVLSWLGYVRVKERIDIYKKERTSDAEFADLNSDGFKDLIMVKDASYKLYIYFNDTMGFFRYYGFLSKCFHCSDAVTYNIDDDLNLDILVPCDAGYILGLIYYNNGDSTFAKDTVDVGYNNADEALVSHSNGDSRPDLIFAITNDDNGDYRNRLYHQTSYRLFEDVSDSVLIPRDNHVTQSVAIGNVNNDSFPDIFFANGYSNPLPPSGPVPNVLYIGQSGWLYRDLSILLSPNDSTYSRSVEFGDVDGDGDDDIVVGNETSPIILYINKLASDSSLIDMSDSLLPAWDSLKVAEVNFEDMDNDNDVDLFVGEEGWSDTLNVYHNANNHIYLNDGSGIYEDRSELFNVESGTDTLVATEGHESSFADIDWDQDLDLIVVREKASDPLDPREEDDLFINLYSQLFVWPKSPRLGQQINLVQTGINGDEYEIWASTDTIYYEDPSHGWQRLDPCCDMLIGEGTLDSTEIDSLQFTIPNDTTLLGDIFIQTKIGPDSTHCIYGNLMKIVVTAP